MIDGADHARECERQEHLAIVWEQDRRRDRTLLAADHDDEPPPYGWLDHVAA